MNSITAAAIGISLTAGVAAAFFVTIDILAVWMAFVAWASFFHCGGGMTGFKSSLAANIWGSLWGFIALILILKFDPGLPPAIWVAIAVVVTVFFLLMGAKFPALAATPAAVYGHATTAGYGLLSGADVFVFDIANPLVVGVLSFTLGNMFGVISEKVVNLIPTEVEEEA